MVSQPHEQNGKLHEQFNDLPLATLVAREAELVSAQEAIGAKLLQIRGVIARRQQDEVWTRDRREIPLEALGLREFAQNSVGKTGLGVRTLAQLLTFSRATLQKHLALYKERSGKLTVGGVINNILDEIDEKLSKKGLALPAEAEPAGE